MLERKSSKENYVRKKKLKKITLLERISSKEIMLERTSIQTINILERKKCSKEKLFERKKF
jgi:hypothetical protein